MNKKINPARVVNLIILTFILGLNFNLRLWELPKRVIVTDVISYYSYLPAAFINKDISLKFVTREYSVSDQFCPDKTPEGKNVIRTTMGLSFLYTPFFFLAHVLAEPLGYQANGFSDPYKLGLIVSAVFYLGLGLYFLRKILEKYFSSVVTAITIFSITIGTNLVYYSSVEAPLAHVYEFSLISLFIYLVIKWWEMPGLKGAILLGLLSGLITLIRPTNIIVLLILISWNITSIDDLKHRLVFFLRSYYLVIAMIISFIIIWVPQIAYWKFITGNYFYNSYATSNVGNFFFYNPQIINGLLSYRKGWLLYTPIMAFALTGIILLFHRRKELFWPVFIFTVLNIFIVLSWWCWWYGGSFGLRAFIDSYSLLAIPFSVFITWLLDQGKLLKIAGFTILVILIGYNLFETKQYYTGAIHWDSMTKKAYWESFGKTYPTSKFYKSLEEPDYEKAIKGIQAVK